MTTLPLALGRAAAERLAGRWVVAGEVREARKTYDLHAATFPDLGLRVGNVGAADAVSALVGCESVQEAWQETPLSERVATIRRLGEVLSGSHDAIAELITLESGKPLRYSRGEVDYALVVLEAMCSSAEAFGGSSIEDAASRRQIAITHRPVGPSLLITPWNFPLSLGLRKVVTALLVGCTIVLKPSDRTPLTSVLIGETLIEAGLPAGVAAVVPTSDSVAVVDALLGHGYVRKLSFTGSTHVGRMLHRRASDQLVRTSLELGGNAPFIMGAGISVEDSLPAIMAAKFASSGQVCTALNRLYVPQTLVTEVVDTLGTKIDELVVAEPFDEAAEIGPMVTREAAARVRGLVSRAVEAGARVRETSAKVPGSEYYVAPAIVSGVTSESEISTSEIFGPVLPVIGYDDLDDAVAQANSTPYGLAAYVASNDPGEVDFLVSRIRAGMIAVNAGSVSAPGSPFGGVGWSGHGRENGVWGLEEFTEVIAVLR